MLLGVEEPDSTGLARELVDNLKVTLWQTQQIEVLSESRFMY